MQASVIFVQFIYYDIPCALRSKNCIAHLVYYLLAGDWVWEFARWINEIYDI